MPTLTPEDWEEPEGEWTPEQVFWFVVGHVLFAAFVVAIGVLESLFAEDA